MVVVLNTGARTPGEAQIRFMNQGGRLRSVVGALAAQLPPCDPAQFFVNQRQQVFQCLLVAGPPSCDQILRSLLGHFTCTWGAVSPELRACAIAARPDLLRTRRCT